MHRRSVRSTLVLAVAAAALAGAVSDAASTAPGAMVVAQTSFEERKVDFVTQTRDQATTAGNAATIHTPSTGPPA